MVGNIFEYINNTTTKSTNCFKVCEPNSDSNSDFQLLFAHTEICYFNQNILKDFKCISTFLESLVLTSNSDFFSFVLTQCVVAKHHRNTEIQKNLRDRATFILKVREWTEQPEPRAESGEVRDRVIELTTRPKLCARPLLLVQLCISSTDIGLET